MLKINRNPTSKQVKEIFFEMMVLLQKEVNPIKVKGDQNGSNKNRYF